MSRSSLPPWIKRSFPRASATSSIHRQTYGKGLHTVCKEALCPNRGECEAQGTATFLILGDRCTRDCRFCAVRHGIPAEVNAEEPESVAASVAALGLRHAVITSVTRDDLGDGGAHVFSETIRAIKRTRPLVTVEVLIPDFQGDLQALETVIDARPDVINHNVETVPRLYPLVRIGASYERSLELLQRVAASGTVAKSGIMVGMGETGDEIESVIRDLVRVQCSILTIGQYLRPSPEHHPVAEYLRPEAFAELGVMALREGIREVVSGPLVRSSYKAAESLCSMMAPPTDDSPQPLPSRDNVAPENDREN
ncbi:lipoyl synthase [Desulfomonile tiedjei]|uniref:Lipoyl synthase n=1 Tax=Desulfomonile tiedjei (strain ATCC 49306 / DSM 6799 / DCB-1) TaxID=706587 RepID=I4CB45_DESTA|nr:lipoyl synthase [Desulfomonile tiedjei]AFM26786.1 lipoate synthase [Desulfomonile tiedjei DSM 6799]